MAQALDLTGLSLNPQEAQASSECVFEKVFAKPTLAETHYVQTGVQMKTQIPFFGQFGLVGLVDPGTCGVNTSAEYIKPTQKYWDPALVSFRLPHCQSNILQLFKLWKRNASALATWEQVDNELLAFLQDRVTDATLESILRISNFGDKAAANIAGGGYIKAGVAPAFFTMIDGLWKQIYDAVAAATIVKVDITENSGVTYAAQNALASDRAITVFRQMFEGADARMFSGDNMPVFQVTRTLFNNYVAYLEDKSLSFMLNRAEEGKTDRYQYRGIPIIVRYDWDRNIRSYEDNATTLRLPHRAILTDIRNVPVGTSNENDFSSFDMFYDKTLKTHYTDVAYYLDCKLLEEYAIMVAY